MQLYRDLCARKQREGAVSRGACARMQGWERTGLPGSEAVATTAPARTSHTRNWPSVAALARRRPSRDHDTAATPLPPPVPFPSSLVRSTRATPRVSKSHSNTSPLAQPAARCAVRRGALHTWRRRRRDSRHRLHAHAPTDAPARSVPRLLNAMQRATPQSRYSSTVSGTWMQNGSAAIHAAHKSRACEPDDAPRHAPASARIIAAHEVRARACRSRECQARRREEWRDGRGEFPRSHAPLLQATLVPAACCMACCKPLLPPSLFPGALTCGRTRRGRPGVCRRPKQRRHERSFQLAHCC